MFNVPVRDTSEAAINQANVYNADNVDYTGAEVNKENFFNVLFGYSSGSGPVLGSDENSRVFVYFVCDGGTGII